MMTLWLDETMLISLVIGAASICKQLTAKEADS